MENRVKEIMASVFGVDSSTIDVNTSPETISTWDSLKHMNLFLELEEEFGVEFSTEQLVEMNSYDAIVSNLKKIISQQGNK